MAIIKNRLKNKFTTLPNALIEDETLTDKGHRIAVYLFSRPDSWNINNSHIMRKFKIKSRDTMSKYWKELITLGWVSREAKPGSCGKFNGFDYTLHEVPCPVQTDTEANHVRSDRTHSNTDEDSNTDNSNNTDSFKEPTVLEVQKYMMEKVSKYIASKESKKFIKYYVDNNWMVGKDGEKRKMTNWKLGVQNWLRNSGKFKAKSKSKPLGSDFKDKGLEL
jgi:hypothetical protein